MIRFLLRAVAVLLAAGAVVATLQLAATARFVSGATRVGGRVVRAVSPDSFRWQYTARVIADGTVRFVDVEERPAPWRVGAAQRYRLGDAVEVFLNDDADPDARFAFDVWGDLPFALMAVSLAGLALRLWRAAHAPRGLTWRVGP
ncbi:MAG TPA: hypothetical protein VGQ78_05045 [Vicinamibacteria bacterium]|nr:hypothetical protein [Vicinamibacteria bacterium]